MLKKINFKNKFHFTSLGCARNLVDSEVMIGILLKAGFEVVSEPKEADFLVVNTCGFLESSRQEGIETIQELFRIKKSDAKVIVAGCMVQKHSGGAKSAISRNPLLTRFRRCRKNSRCGRAPETGSSGHVREAILSGAKCPEPFHTETLRLP